MNRFKQKIQKAVDEGAIPKPLAENLAAFVLSYLEAAAESGKAREAEQSVLHYLQLYAKECTNPFTFPHYHQKDPEHYKFGIEYFRNVVNQEKSKILGQKWLAQLDQQIKKGENAFLLANHQSEGDPQIIQLLLQKSYPHLAENMIFVAGHRVSSDPIAKPFSMGVNLLCIFSKRYIEHPPEHKTRKLHHNQKTMMEMRALLEEGGKCIYIAPSGGRDRPNAEGNYTPAPFDPPSLEMTLLQGKRVSTPTHFYPLSLLTHSILPPPATVQHKLGEERFWQHSPAFLAFGEPIDPQSLIKDLDSTDKKLLRKMRCEKIWQMVCDNYHHLQSQIDYT